MNKLTAWIVAASALTLTMIGGISARAQISDDVVKIGVLNDQSGAYSDLAGRGSVIAAQLAIEDFGGTVAGKPIELVSADHQNKPDIGSNIVNRWIDVDHVDAVFDVPTSSVALAVQEITKNKNRIFVDSTAGTSDLTGKACSPTGMHWTYDTFALAHGTGTAMTKAGGDSWFFITADYAFGLAMEKDAGDAIRDAGGSVSGSVKAPFPTSDFSSFLLQAQSSGAKVVGLANAGADTINSIKQAHEFGLTQSGQKLAGMLTFITDVHSLGLDTAQGLILTDAWYWDRDEESRAWAKRWAAKMGTDRMPTSVQAGVYSAVSHYLKAIQLIGTDDAKKVAEAMRALPVNDMFAKNGVVRADGRMVHDMYLLQVKTPAESKYPWDYFKVLRTIPGVEAFRPLEKSACPLLHNAVAAQEGGAAATVSGASNGLFGVSQQVLMGQLLLGLINGAFYAVLSLGLALIFGLLNIINFAHGAQYMMGSFAAWLLLNYLGIGYWPALILAPLIVGVVGMAIERTLLRRLQQVDHIYGLLLTFGLALLIEGAFRQAYGISGQTYPVPDLLKGGVNLGFMFLPLYRGWVVVASLLTCLAVWALIERTRLGALLRAATENPALVQSFGVNVPVLITVTYGFGAALAAFAGVLAAPIYSVNPLMGSNIIIIVFAVVVIGGMGSVLGSVLTGFALGLVEGLTKVFYPEASSTVIFIVMALILLVKPAGLFGRSH